MEQKNTIHDILTQREEFIVIGLTGRMGSGCSKVADVLARPFEEMHFPHPAPQPGMRSLTEEERTIRIIAEYAEKHWLKFDIIQVSAIIATFILNDDSRFINDLNSGDKANKHDDLRVQFQQGLLKSLYEKIVGLGKDCGLLNKTADIKYYIESKSNTNDEQTEENKLSKDYTKLFENFFVRKLADGVYNSNLKRELKNIGENLKKIAPDDETITECFSEAGETSFYSAVVNIEKPTDFWKKVGTNMMKLYRQVPQRNAEIHRRKYLECVDNLLTLFSAHCLIRLLDVFQSKNAEAAKEMWEWLNKINQSIEPDIKSIEPDIKDDPQNHQTDLQIQKFVFVKYITGWLGRFIRKFVTETLGNDAYARLFQRYGQMIRYHGCIPKCKEKAKTEETAVPDEGNVVSSGDNSRAEKDDIFAIPRKINQHIKALRNPFFIKDHRPVRVVIDSIKNIFEAVYLRYRYSAFYLWAITTDADIREKRLHDKHLTDIQVRMMDWNEYPDKGRDVIRAADDLVKGKEGPWNTIRKTLMRGQGEAEANFYLDCFPNKPLEKGDTDAIEAQNKYYEENEEFNRIRREFFRNNTYPFYMQDIDSCVCNADVYLFNNATGDTDVENNRKLLEAVVRNVSLVMYPCLVRPTPVERCMQIAFGAKVNSGCLSRQVGAVVTDSQYNILAIGWNDVPCGEVPCAYKNLKDISVGADQDAYSEYELHNDDFRERLKKYIDPSINLRGLPFSYCFKNVQSDVKDPMRSRAMHAEEKALALCGREAEGGYLFTTSSPCEMCSKKAKNHKIKKIFYLEAYPGISQAQYTNSGDKSNRAKLILFSGAVGRAYMQMYTPLLPHKDVLAYLGVRKK